MHIQKLDHVNLRTTQLDTMIAWYTDVLGLRAGARPKFPFPGAWLYAGDNVVVHLVGIDGAPCVGSEADLKLEHFAMTATGLAAFQQRLDDRNERYKRSEIEEIQTVAFNVWDPDGNHIHVDFSSTE